MKHLRLFIMVVLVNLALAAATFAQSSIEKANAYFQAQNWSESAKAYEEITKAEPANGQAWFRLGMSLHSMGKYEQAVIAFQKSVAIGNNPIAMYDLACAYARMNDKNNAIQWLNKSINAGFPQLRQIKNDADFESLKDDARFQEILASAAKKATPCAVAPEYAQFDFWVGDWEVRNPQGQVVGYNSVQKVVDGCIVQENWTDTVGGGGKSFNYYNSVTGKWYQKWVGSGGGVLELAGEYKDGAMRYEGITLGNNGSKTFEKLTFFNLGADKVRQLWEQSYDDGKTWKTVFDGMYLRKK